VLIQADARHLPLSDQSVHCVVTSPPYWGLRRYGGDDREIGTRSLKHYVEDEIPAIAAEIGRVLRDDGLFWLNIGDTAAGSGGSGGDYNKGGSKHGKPKWRQGESGLTGGQWCLVPERIMLSLQDHGWLIRKVIIWNKGRMRPEDLRHVRRPLIQHEVIIMMAKRRGHRFYPEKLVEKGDIWTFPPAKEGRGHYAPFPKELPARCILASTLPGDVVLDPFVGSGSTLRACEELDRLGIAADLYI
jgi:site-specific DNA-methyltransferase (adenine-specific)